MSTSGGLTEEQRKRMEENRLKALAKRQKSTQLPSSSGHAKFQPPPQSSSFQSSAPSPGKPPPPWKNNQAASSTSTIDKSSGSTGSKSFYPSSTPTKPPWQNNSKSGSDSHPCQANNNNTNTSTKLDKTSQSSNKPPWLANKTSHTNDSTDSGGKPVSKTLPDKEKPPWLANKSTSQHNNTTNYEPQTSSDKQKPAWLQGNQAKNVNKEATSTSKQQSWNMAPLQSKPNATEKSSMGSGSSKVSITGQCILVSRSRFCVVIGYSAVVIEIFKSMTTKLYDANTKKWSFSLHEYDALMQKVRPLSPDVHIAPLPSCVRIAFAEHLKGRYEERKIPDADLSSVDRQLVQALMPFQREGVNFALHRKGRLLFADDMGLGKTIQAICVACYYREEWPVLVVVPSSVRFAWREQFLKWVPSLDPQRISVVVNSKESCTSGLVNIISYDLMVRLSEPLMAKGFNVVIMDESHSIKSIKTTRTKVAMPLLKRAKRVLLLSGTPALSRPSELFQQISSVDSKVFSKFHDFGIRYCDGKQNNWGWDFSGSSNLAELQLILEERIMIRRLKKDVLHQLPSKIREMIILDPCCIKATKSMKASHSMVNKMKGNERRGALLEYFHETCCAKASAVKEYVCDLLEGERKLLVFAHHQEMLDVIEEAVVKKNYGYIRIDGSTSAEQRNFFTNKFQEQENVRIAILSIMAANSGLNLTAASLVVFAELFWNPGILVQAEDRAHRIGQEDSVNVHYLVAQGTADDYVWPLVQSKLDVLSRAGLTGDDFSSTDTRRHTDPRQQQMMQYFQQCFIDEEAPQGTPPDWDSPRKNLFVSPTKKPSRKRSANSQSPSPAKAARAAPRTPVKQTSLFQYFQPSPKKTTDTPASDPDSDVTPSSSIEIINPPARETEEKTVAEDIDYDFDEDFFGIKEDNPDDDWPPPAKKSKF